MSCSGIIIVQSKSRTSAPLIFLAVYINTNTRIKLKITYWEWKPVLNVNLINPTLNSDHDHKGAGYSDFSVDASTQKNLEM